MILDPIDGMTCGACHSPPRSGFSVGPLPSPPNDNTGLHSNGCATTKTNVPPACAPACNPSHVPPAGVASLEATRETIANRPFIFDDSVQFPEFSPDSDSFDQSASEYCRDLNVRK
jgi:hypothetical protein